jgi:hypothetical protein
MRRYLCIVRLPPGDRPAIDAERGATLEALRRTGQLTAAAGLEPADAGVVVRVRAGHASVAITAPTDGSTIDAVFVIEARDLNEAIQLAARDPGARHGLVEVRPLRTFG